MNEADALFFATEPALATFVEETLTRTGMLEPASRWIKGELMAIWNPAEETQAPLSPDQLARLANLLQTGTITDRTARALIPELAETGLDPVTVVEQRGLTVCSDPDRIRTIILAVLTEDPELINRHQDGDGRVVHHLMGQVMARTNGQADPALTRQLVVQSLERQS